VSRHKGSGHNRHGARGRHKKGSSPETLAWNREHLIPPPPPWMDAATYAKLAALRSAELDRGTEPA
jgi:hypothetical protein